MQSTKNGENVLNVLSLCCLLALHIRQTAAGLLPLVLSEANEAPPAAMPSSNHSSSAHSGEKLGSIEYLPDGTLILRGAAENGTNLPNLLLFKGVLGALGAGAGGSVAQQPANKWNIKIYGDGVEHKFPPFLERIIQRIQSYFSVYKYTDTSRPLQQPVVVQGGAAATVTNYLTAATTTAKTTTAATSMTAAALQPTNALGAEGSGANAFSGSSSSDAPIFVHIDAASDDDDYTEFIAIGEHDDFITVGED